MNDDRPRLIGVFPSQFPGWGRGEPHDHPGQSGACTMYRSPRGGGFETNWRFVPVGVSAIDDGGQLWVLVDDWAVEDLHKAKRWVRFPVEFIR